MLNITQDGGEVLIELDATANGWKGGEDADGIIHAAAAGAVATFGPELERLHARYAQAIEAGRTAERRIAELERERTVARSRLFGTALSGRFAEIKGSIASAEDAKADAGGEATAIREEMEHVREKLERECGDSIKKAIRAKAPAIQATRDDTAARLRKSVEELLAIYLRAVAALKYLQLSASKEKSVIRQAMQTAFPSVFGDDGLMPIPVGNERSKFDPQTVATNPDADDWMESDAERLEGTAKARNWRGLR